MGGIRPADPAYTTIFFRPAEELAKWADTTVFTVSGRLQVRWEHLESGEFRITVDSTYPVRFLPALPPEVRELAIFDTGPQVTIIDDLV